MSKHVLFIDSKNLREIENFDVSFLECFTADSSMDDFLIIFIMFSYDFKELMLSHFLRFEFID